MKTIGKHCVNRPVTRSQIKACKLEHEKLPEPDITPANSLKDNRGEKRPPMKTIGKCCVNYPIELPERNIFHVYGLDSMSRDHLYYWPELRNWRPHMAGVVYTVDTSAVLFGKRGKKIWIDFLPFLKRKERTNRAMDDEGRVFYTSFTCPFHENREKSLLEAWPMVVSSLNSVGISCSLNLVNWIEKKYGQVKERSITFSTTLRTRGGSDTIDKAMDLLEILTFTDVPPLLAIQILDGSLQYDIIRTGLINNGYGRELSFVSQEKLLPDLMNDIKLCIKELAKLSHCDIFFNGINVIAFGNSQLGLKLVRYIIKSCIFNIVKPASMMKGLNYFRQNGGKLENAETNILGLHPVNASLSGPSLDQDGMLVCGAFFHEVQGKVLGKAWPIVQSTLKKYGISCTLHRDVCFMTISTKDRNMIKKARSVLELLTSRVVPSRALLVLTDSMKCDIIKTGYQYDGLGRKAKMNMKRLTEQLKLLLACRQDLEKVTHCDIYITGEIVAAIGRETEQLSLVRNLVTRCFVGKEDPASMIREIELEPEKKKQKI